jgi:DNA-binding PadR family transcriptional regulator
MKPRISIQGIKVLQAFMERGGGELSGSEIATTTGLLSGTLYPMLVRFEKAGLLTHRWEEGEPSELRRPRRRFYRITAEGQLAYRSVSKELTSFGRLVWSS